MKYLLTGILICFCSTAVAQNTFRITVANRENEPLPGATITWKEKNQTFVADSLGMINIPGIPDGVQTFVFSHAGYEEESIRYTFPLVEVPYVVMLHPEEEHEEEVIVTATRISRTITNTPTRIEVISGEELAEKGNMKPGEIRMLLSESTGIQTQQTSATSYNSAIRIQGLDGRYTQILRDGYPLYAGFSGGLSIMQITPLDLRQVEVIKGSSSTLYGGGAIAGLVNLVSKTPGSEPELSFVANATTAGGLDLSGFYSVRKEKAGVTFFASRNSSKPYDPADIGLTAIPKFERYTINPRLFLYGKNTTADIGVSYITEDRIGGSIDYIKNGGAGFFEENKTARITTQLGIAHRVANGAAFQFKNSYSRFNRQIAIRGYQFQGLHQSSFSELSWNHSYERTQWVVGANVLTDDLAEEKKSSFPVRDYHLNTYGVFVQNVWTISGVCTLESGLRGDYVNDFGFEILPRISALFQFSPRLTTRIGGGFGYKTPTVFNEDAERVQFRTLLPIDVNNTQNERSVGGNWDINYRTAIGAVRLTVNHLLFYTRLQRPLIWRLVSGGTEFTNADGHIDTKGMETNLRLLFGHFKLFVGYTFTDAHTNYYGRQNRLPLTARHRLNNVLMYELEERFKLGLEAYFFSAQQLNDRTTGKAYWIAGLMAEKMWEHFSIFINFENFTDTRQTRFDTIYSGTLESPFFRDIYAPVDGFVINGGLKIRL